MNRFFLLLLLGAFCSTDLSAQSAEASFSIPTSTFFLQTDLERGYVLCPTGTGNFYVAGMKNVDMVLLEMTSEGAFVSSRYIDVGITGLDAIAQIIVDSDGNLVIAGNLKEDQADNGYVFRYDPVFRQTLWAKTFGGDQTLVYGLLENGPGGNFLVYANPHVALGDDAEFFQLDRSTGNMVPGTAWRYHLGTSDNFHQMVLHNGDLYATGRFTDGIGSIAYADMRHTLMKIDPATGAIAWTQLGHIASGKTARLYGRGLVVDGDAIVSTFSGNDAGANLDVSHVFLQKNTLDGALVWTQKIDLTEWNTEFVEEIVSVADGYVLYGRTLSNEAVFLLKTDKNGGLMWTRKVQHTTQNSILGTAQGQLVAVGDYLFATGFSSTLGSDKMFLLKSDGCGTLSDSCAAFLPTSAAGVDWPNAVSYAVTPTVDTSFTFAFDLPVAPPVNFVPQKQILCEKVVNNCPDMADLTFVVDNIQCMGGGLNLTYTICNEGDEPVTGNVPVRFYADDPTQTTAQELTSTLIFLNQPLGPNQCVSGVLTGFPWFFPGTSGPQVLFSVVNHDGSLPVPFSFNDFPTTSLEECDYTNNLSGIAFNPPASPVLNLGPDVILCSDSVVVFDAGPGFLTYLWQDGSSGQASTAVDPGIYWVEATDDCGRVQRDSVFFSFSLLPDTKFGDTTICPGESVTYSLNGFSNYSWGPATGLSCTDCPIVVASPVITTEYTVFASDANGCELYDTMLVTVRTIPVLSLGPDIILCMDTTIVFDAGPGFVSYLWQDGSTASALTAIDPGTYSVAATDACGGVQRDSVFFSFSLLPDTKFGDTTICPGESVTYSLNGFTNYSWGPATGLSCTNCPTVVASPANTTKYTVFASDANGCELRDTFTVTVHGMSNLNMQCPGNVTVTAAAGAQSAAVTYADPGISTDCLCGGAVWAMTQGFASGANFPIGQTQVCFSAEDGCNTAVSCCFTVTVEQGPDLQDPCDVKETPCLRFEILGISQNAAKQKTYRMNVINKCANELMHVAYQLPNGMTAKAPANGSIYISPAGRQYEVRNPSGNAIRFKTLGTGIANGESDIFEYRLPAQADPAFIYTLARLKPQIYVETHLNTFACVVTQTVNHPDAGDAAEARNAAENMDEKTKLHLFPNPVTNRLHVDLAGWQDEPIRLQVTDAYGRALLDSRVWASGQLHALDVPENWPSGVYFLTIVRENGTRASGRFTK